LKSPLESSLSGVIVWATATDPEQPFISGRIFGPILATRR
jgi:hypothetical protein